MRSVLPARTLPGLLAALGAGLVTATAQAVVVIGFEGINATYPSTSYADILGFYSGGMSSQGTSGANLGVSFAPNAVAVCLNALGGTCSNASRAGSSATSSQGGLGIGSGNSTYFDYPAGFTFAIGFRYAVAPGSFATIAAYSGPGGTGALLAPPLVLLPGSAGCPAYNATLCPMGPGGYSFTGVAQSVVFTGQPGHVVWDDLTLGANDPQSPSPVPEPASGLLFGLGLAGIGVLSNGAQARRRAQWPACRPSSRSSSPPATAAT